MSGTEVCVSIHLKGIQLGSGLGFVTVSKVHPYETHKIII